MTSEREKPLMELVGNLCDQRMEAGDLEALNRVLRSDPIAQEEYLDQLLADGWLQREMGGFPNPSSTASERQNGDVGGGIGGGIGGVRAAVVAMVLAIIGGVWWSRAEDCEDVQLVLTNASFEEAAEVREEPTQQGWYGDRARVVSAVAGVSPHHGDHMLQFEHSAPDVGRAREIYQIVDLQSVWQRPANRSVVVEAEAVVNSLLAGDTDCPVFSIQIYALTSDPLSERSSIPARWRSAVSFVGNQVAADADHLTWQRLSSEMPLGAEARYLVIQISVRQENSVVSERTPTHFVDNVTLRLKNYRSKKRIES